MQRAPHPPSAHEIKVAMHTSSDVCEPIKPTSRHEKTTSPLTLTQPVVTCTYHATARKQVWETTLNRTYKWCRKSTDDTLKNSNQTMQNSIDREHDTILYSTRSTILPSNTLHPARKQPRRTNQTHDQRQSKSCPCNSPAR